MEAFSLLRYWRGGGVVGTDTTTTTAACAAKTRTTNTTAAADTNTTTILTAVTQNRDETDDEDDDNDGDDDGPFFDLEFAVPDEDEADDAQNRDPSRNSDSSTTSADESDVQLEAQQDEDDDDESDDGVDGEREFNFTVSSRSSNDRTDHNLSLSPSDDLFFKGKLVPIEPSSIVFNPSEPNSKPQFAGSLLKSATKFRVFMLGLKKSKSNSTGSEKTEPAGNGSVPVAPKEPHQKNQEKKHQNQEPQQKNQQGKFFTVKFKVEEVPIVSLFTRDNSSRISTNNNKTQTQKQSSSSEDQSAASEEKRFSKEVVHKYLKMVKPLYVRVSRRYGDKLRLSGQLNLNGSQPPTSSSPVAAADKAEKSQSATEVSEAVPAGNARSLKLSRTAGLRVVCKHLGKSRSASSAVAAAPPGGAVLSRRRDDSLLQQQDGIQSAILHCKRSFNAARDSDSSLLSRSVSDPSNDKSSELSRKSSDQGKGVAL